MKAISDFGKGFQIFWSSFAILRRQPSLRKLIYIPMLISLVFFIGSLFLLGGGAITYLMTLFPIDPGLFYWIIYAIFFMISFLFSVLVTFIFANLLSLPFYVAMTEKHWKLAYNWQSNDYKFTELIRLIAYFTFVGILKALILSLIAILCFALSFFPIFSIIVAFFGLMLIAFDCCDVSFELLEYDLGDRFSFVKRHFWPYVGFTCGLSIVSLIPGFNFVFLPFMVLSASELVYKLDKEA